jgi:hypothetical protein
MATVKLPLTSFIEMQNNEVSWELLRKGLIQKPISCTGKIEIIPDEKKVTINIVITKVIHSDDVSVQQRGVSMQTNLGENTSKGMAQIFKFFWDFSDSDCYTLFGYIDGANHIPIIIVWYAKFNFAIYTQKSMAQSSEEFFPKALNPQDN